MTPASTADDKLAAFQSLWEERRAGRPLPERRDFQVEDFRPWLGHVCITRLEPETGRCRMTLCGTAAAEYFGVDLTGKLIDDVFPQQRFGWLFEMYRECERTRRPVSRTTPPFTYEGTYRTLKRVLLPCGTGETVDTFLLCIYAVR
ncbi:PAS domain-containing protein [Azospirillum sp.]|uniref:PAS domain-containing protein n=1 Tax=Azospirillum sp. TaxID=34012 RepID=UPI002D6636CB|nr:PAS domain-containing protein [Azospirillum sp.]HYD65121.1 PAS domain-containing protein [Azospirillum sp.]